MLPAVKICAVQYGGSEVEVVGVLGGGWGCGAGNVCCHRLG